MSENKAQYQAGEQQQLKPCPFCGSNNVFWGEDDSAHVFWGEDDSAHVYFIFCANCSAEGAKTPFLGDSASERWNTRAADAEVERLRAQLAQAKAALEVLATEGYYTDYNDSWRSPDCGLRLEHETVGKDAPHPWQFAADALKGLE